MEAENGAQAIDIFFRRKGHCADHSGCHDA